MCDTEVTIDGAASTSSGGDREVRATGEVTVEIFRYNYVYYDSLGDNLADGALAWIGRALSPAQGDFTPVSPAHGNALPQLLALFNADSIGWVPRDCRQYVSRAQYDSPDPESPNPNYIYLLNNETGQITELEYIASSEWNADIFEDTGDGWEAVDTRGSQQGYFRINLNHVEQTFAIAFPERVLPETIFDIFSHGATRDLCQIRLANNPHGADRRLLIFDPAHIVKNSARIIASHARFMRLVDANVSSASLGRTSARQELMRTQGILAAICHQLVEADSGNASRITRSELDPAYQRYADFSQRRALFFDNMYNFLRHTTMRNVQRKLMTYVDDDARPEGAVWLRIIAPMAEIMGEHQLMMRYFEQESGEPETESAWSAFYADALRAASREPSASVRVWTQVTGSGDYVKLVLGAAELSSFVLVQDYVRRGSRVSWDDFSGQLDDTENNLQQFSRAARLTGRFARRMRQVPRIVTHAKAFGRLRGITTGDGGLSSYAAVVGAIETEVARRGAKGLALRLTAIKNTLDLYANIGDLDSCLRVDDYDAAFGYSVAIGAGLVEIGYLAIFGVALTGPAAVVVTLVGAIAAIYASTHRDTRVQQFLQRSSYGTDAGGSFSDPPSWVDGPTRQWISSVGDGRLIGPAAAQRAQKQALQLQLNSLVNLLHEFKVKHIHTTASHVIEIAIETKFLPENAKWEFHGVFGDARGGSLCTVDFTLDGNHMRSRVSNSRHVNRAIGHRIRRDTSARKHTITFNLGHVSDSVRTGEGWLRCFPFGHDEFVVPCRGTAGSSPTNCIHLEQLGEPSIGRREYPFHSRHWASWPG